MASLEHSRVPSPRPIATKEIPLIDRVEEMDVLKEAVYKAVHGEGGGLFSFMARALFQPAPFQSLHLSEHMLQTWLGFN